MGSTDPREYRTVYRGVTRGSSSNSWQPCALLSVKILSSFADLWNSMSGTGRAGHTMQRVRSPFCPSVGTNLSVWLLYRRNMAFTKSRVSAHPHTLWFNKPQLALGTPRHRIILCNDRKLCDCSEETSARVPRAEELRRRLERRQKNCATIHKTSSLAFEWIPVTSTIRYPNNFPANIALS